jgi:ornithine cyclodeaminase
VRLIQSAKNGERTLVVRIYSLEEIKQAIEPVHLIQCQEEGFVAYSEGQVVVPPPGSLFFDDPPGDCHIKFGYLIDDVYYVIKIASGFYRNPDLGLPSSNGMMLVFERKTGVPAAVLLDEGYLTDMRTAAAGAIAAKYLAPLPITRIGIVGTGTQARLQPQLLREVTPCRDLMVWGRNAGRAEAYRRDVEPLGFAVEVAARIQDLCAACNLIVTTTPSRSPLIGPRQVRPGTHITAVGADGGGKQELDAELFKKASVFVVDSRRQCRELGDSSYALKAGFVKEDQLVELGTLIRKPELGRTSADQITICDLTGVAVQDIQIAKLAMAGCVGRAG